MGINRSHKYYLFQVMNKTGNYIFKNSNSL
jgi:hypothetical protein